MARLTTSTILSRRSLLKWAGLGGVAAFAAGCGGASPTAAPATQVIQVVEKEKIVEKIVTVTPAPTAAKQVKLSYTTDWNTGVRKEYIDKMKAEFMRVNPNITLDVWHMGSGGTTGPGGVADIVTAQLLTKSSADLINGWSTQAATTGDVMADLGPAMQLAGIDVKKDFLWGAGEQTDATGRLVGLPFMCTVSGYAYNKDMFKKEGVAEPTEEWTWDDMLEAAKKLTKPADQQYGIWASGPGTWTSAQEIVGAAGGTYRTKDGTKTNMCGAGALDAFERYIDLIYKHKVAPNPATVSALAGVSNIFSQGKCGMRPISAHNTGDACRQAAATGFTLSLMPNPKDPKTKKACTMFIPEPNLIPEFTKERGTFDAAVKLALFMMSDWSQKLFCELRPASPVALKWLDSPEWLKPCPENQKQVKYNVANYFPMSAMPFKQYGEWWSAFYSNWGKAWTGEVPAKDALMAACKAGDAVLAKYPPAPWKHDLGFYKELGTA